MTSRTHRPIPQIFQAPSGRCADWSYDKLAELKQMAVNVRDSEFLWPHEHTHLAEIVERIDLTVSLKRQRESCWAKKASPRGSYRITGSPVDPRLATRATFAGS
jgi:hypothetical protein